LHDAGDGDDDEQDGDDYGGGRSQILSNGSLARVPGSRGWPEMCWGPRRIEGPNYMEEEVVTVGRAGRLSITPRQNVPVV
jgi:hypothetical protein